MEQFKYISHRGNINGKSGWENSPNYIVTALMAGYDVEIDLWLHKDKPYLGHDEPTYEVSPEFLSNSHFWIHAKNKEALNYLVNNGERFHYFWHNTDWYTITSKGFVWVYPGNRAVANSIAVLPESENVTFDKLHNAFLNESLVGICSDIIETYKGKFIKE